jgi:transcription antitermination factor NusG
VEWDSEGEAVNGLAEIGLTEVGRTEIGTTGEMTWTGQSPAEDRARWYALHTRARHEKSVEKRLREKGMETFLPVSHELHTWSDRKKKVEMPLFNCYVFVRCKLSAEDRTKVYEVDSIHGFVGVRGAGVPIPDEQIEAIRTVLEKKTPWRSHPFLKAGQRVRVRGGALDGIEGVFLSENGDNSLVISVDAIQRSMAVRIDGYNVEPV